MSQRSRRLWQRHCHVRVTPFGRYWLHTYPAQNQPAHRPRATPFPAQGRGPRVRVALASSAAAILPTATVDTRSHSLVERVCGDDR
ncbi:hypothetical protein NJ7G_0546 [Natrinema sp. J7-2]|nr:hypothetical protein NJ7G_0546 [Natrinema sp. J7-2]